MASASYKWLIVLLISNVIDFNHPIFLSVTEIEHNATAKTLEISCKIFTDDFETALRKVYNTKIDLLNAKFKNSMNVLVNDYIQKHLSVKTNGKPATLNFLGFEQQEEGIVSFYEVKGVATIEKLEVFDNILYEFKDQQIEIIHVLVNGNRKSTRLNNPDANAVFEF